MRQDDDQDVCWEHTLPGPILGGSRNWKLLAEGEVGFGGGAIDSDTRFDMELDV